MKLMAQIQDIAVITESPAGQLWSGPVSSLTAEEPRPRLKAGFLQDSH